MPISTVANNCQGEYSPFHSLNPGMTSFIGRFHRFYRPCGGIAESGLPEFRYCVCSVVL